MNTTLRILIALLLVLASHFNLWADACEDFESCKVSLLTCQPGEAGYELYGHTALRVYHPKTGSDLTYNYGIFDFDSPNFTWRFILGETNYMLGVSTFNRFFYLYAMQGRAVDEQVLNLTAKEKERLVRALEQNALPENRVYRYDFFSNNCVTKVIDKIAEAVDGTLVFPQAMPGQTFRMMLDDHTSVSPWNQFGQSLLLGADADTLVGLREQCFSPVYTQRFFKETVVVNQEGVSRPLVTSERVLLHAKSSITPMSLTPKVVLALLLVLSFCISWLYVKGWKRTFACFDTALLVIIGLGGCLLATLCFASEHPAVSRNYTLLLLHPLTLLYLPLQWLLKRKEKTNVTAYLQLLFVAAYIVCVDVFQIQEPTIELNLIAATIAVLNLAKIYKERVGD
ncbi:MAG: DUF4105 domain-containing protein [Bacteroidaceae bacterium]|nr:DUF4105 domain-containing protein [Bacteroidaceae bacterium]